MTFMVNGETIRISGDLGIGSEEFKIIFPCLITISFYYSYFYMINYLKSSTFLF